VEPLNADPGRSLLLVLSSVGSGFETGAKCHRMYGRKCDLLPPDGPFTLPIVHVSSAIRRLPMRARSTQLVQVLLAGLLVLGGAGVLLTLFGIETWVRGPLVLLLLLTGPALAAALLLPNLDPLSLSVVALATTVAVNAVVAGTMLAIGVWSISGGVAAVAGITVVVCVAAWRIRRVPDTGEQQEATTPAAGSDVVSVDQKPARLRSILGSQQTGRFSLAMRGYDRAQVEAHIRQLELALHDATARVNDLESQSNRLQNDLIDANDRLQEGERPPYSALGSRTEQWLRVVEEQAAEVVASAVADAKELRGAARVEVDHLRAAAVADVEERLSAAKQRAEELIEAARSESDQLRETAAGEIRELKATAERDAAKILSSADHDIAGKRSSVERELSSLRALADHEAAQLRVTAKRDTDELRAATRQEAEELLARASTHLQEALALADQETPELKAALGARRKEEERRDAERHAAAVGATNALVGEAESRAAVTVERATKIMEAAEKTKRQADTQAKATIDTARHSADSLIADAAVLAERTLDDARSEAKRIRSAAQRQVHELTRQRDEITEELKELHTLLASATSRMASRRE
jgi:hypothetical protein